MAHVFFSSLAQSILLLGSVALACLALDLLFLLIYSCWLCCRRKKSDEQPNTDCCCTAWCVIIATLVCRWVWMHSSSYQQLIQAEDDTCSQSLQRDAFIKWSPAGKTSFCLLECERKCVLSEGLQGLISGWEVISVLISVIHLELSLGFSVTSDSSSCRRGVILPVAPKLLSGKG